jgi:predicted transcriptional regulator
MALLFGLAGLFGNPFLIFIALFVWIGATQEAAMTQIKAALGGIPVEQAMITDFRTLAPSDTLAHATDLMLAGAQQDFPVVEGDRVVGVLTRANLLGALANMPREAPVSGVMRGDVPTAEAAEMIEFAFERLRGCDCHTMPVLRQGRLVGLLTMENVGEFVSVQTATAPPLPPARPRR